MRQVHYCIGNHSNNDRESDLGGFGSFLRHQEAEIHCLGFMGAI